MYPDTGAEPGNPGGRTAFQEIASVAATRQNGPRRFFRGRFYDVRGILQPSDNLERTVLTVIGGWELERAQVNFQLPDLLRQRRLRDVQPLCGASEVQFHRDGAEYRR